MSKPKFKYMLSLLLGLVCNVAWAQTSYFKMGTSTTSLSDGNYVLVAMSDKGTGPVIYDPNAGEGKHYRYEDGKTFAAGDVVSSKYVWTIDETTADGVQHITVTNYDDNNKAFPADESHNQNFTGSGVASLLTEVKTIGEANYIALSRDIVVEGNTAKGYVHANKPSGNPCLSYWESYDDNGSCVKFTFYPVTPTTEAPLFVEPVVGGFYKLKGDNSAKPWLTNQLTGNSIVVSADEADAAIFERTTNGLKDVATGKYLGMTGDVVSLVANETNVTIGEYYNDTEDGRKYSVKANTHYMYNNNTDGKTHESSDWLTNIERYWGFIEPASIGFTVNMTTGAFGGSGNYRTSWALSNGLLTLTCPAANMNSHDGLVQLHSGQSSTCTYTLTVPRGYTILGYSFDYAFGNSGTGEKNFEVGGVDYTVTSESQTLTVEDVNATTTTFKLEGANQPVKMSNFVVKVKVPTAEEIAAVKSEAKATVRANAAKLDDALGYYSYTANGVKLYTADEVKAAIDAVRTIAEVDAIVASYALNVPEVGKYYRIKGISGNYIDAVQCYSGTQMGMKSNGACNYLGTIFLLDEGNRLKNVVTGTYVHGTRHIGETKANANTWTFAASTRTLGCITLTAAGGNSGSSTQLHDNSGTHADRCGSICGNRHDFTIEEVKAVGLTINAPGKLNVSATWNGETKTLPATWITFIGVTITESTLRGAGNATYAFTGFSEGDQSLGSEVTITSMDADRTLTANFAPSFFGTTLAEATPVHIYNDNNNSYFIRLNATDGFAGKALNSGTCTYTESEMWYFVGTPENFKMYNHKAGADYAVKVAGTGGGSAATMATVADATSLKLTLQSDGSYRIAPQVGDGNTGFNMYGGAGKDIALHNGDGSDWLFRCISKDALTLNVSVDQVWESSPRVAELTFTVNDAASTTRILGNVEGQALYLPVGATYEVSSMTYRGYTYNGCTDNDGVLTASYTANDERTLYYNREESDGKPNRIPAIATAPNGDIFAISDHRPCGNDIGYGEVDLVCRVSSDNGATWTESRTIADGLGHTNDGIWKMGFGDPAIVADRESNKVLVMSVCGNRTCWDGNYGVGGENENPNRMSRLYIEHDGEKWVYGEPEEVTYDIYPLFVDENGTAQVTSMFIGAGKICQSRVVKKGDYYRLYCAVWAVKGNRSHHNYVIYSDDFGESWNVLGNLGQSNSPAPAGNEPKCEELPDGTVVLSSRKGSGRYFNLFTFNNEGKSEEYMYTTGSWGTCVSSNNVTDGLSFGGNDTNGEIYKVKAIHNESGRICDVMLQSVPTGGGRDNVAIFYKEMEYNENGTNKYTPETFAQGWTKGKHVSTKGSAYSTMILQADGRLGFYFEEFPGDAYSYCLVYIPYSIEDVTGGAYSLYTVNSTISEHGIGTFYATSAMQIPEGVQAYVVEADDLVMKGENGYIEPTELEGIIPANTGAILMGDAGETYQFIPSISYGTPVEGNMLVGYEAANNSAESYENVALPNDGSTTYVLAVENDKAGFYKKVGGFKVYNNKAYLQVPVVSGARAIYFDFGGETGILETENGNVKTENCYDLSGRRVVKAQKGIYIVNGKKVVY